MLTISFEYRLDNRWIAYEVEAISYEKKGLGIEVKVGEKKFEYYEPVRRIEVFSLEELKAKEERWKGKTEGVTAGKFIAGSKFLVDLQYDEANPEVEYIPSGKVYCSFCKRETSNIVATTGIGSFEIGTIDVVISKSPLITEERKKVVARKVIACRDCAHLIRPITHKVNGKDEIKIMNCTTYSEG